MNEEEKKLKKLIGKENPFILPEGYFDRFSAELMNNLPEQEPFPEPAPRRGINWKPYLYMAAMFAGAALIIRIAREPATVQESSSVADTETEQLLINTSVDGAMLDDYSLYVYLSDTNL
ncbi:MAG: hypothetical protein SPJ97_03445 [Bacteroides sp.]|nr:hypothetical protein [Bacteroides sp.]